MPSQINPRSGPFPVYSSASPATVDVGIFTIAKTSVDLKTAGTTDIFTVPTGRTYTLIGTAVLVTSVTSGGSGTLAGAKVQESSASRSMTGSAFGTSAQTPVAGQTMYIWFPSIVSIGAIASTCTASNKVQFVITASNAGSTAVTGTVYLMGFYVS